MGEETIGEEKGNDIYYTYQVLLSLLHALNSISSNSHLFNSKKHTDKGTATQCILIESKLKLINVNGTLSESFQEHMVCFGVLGLGVGLGSKG